jgi:hypothetical protein
LVPYSDSVYKTPKTHFDLLLLKLLHGGKLLSNVNSKEKGDGFMSHLYSTLGCCGRGGKAAAAGEGTSGGGRKKNDWRKELSRLFIQKPNCNQGLKLNYRSVIHPTSESSM